MKRIGVSFIFIIVVLSGSFHRISHNRTFRRCRAISFYYLIQELKSGEREEISQVFHDGDYEIHVWGKHLPAITEKGEFSYPHAFLSIQVYENGQKIGYLCIFPTSKGYRAVSSTREQKGEPLYLGNLATHMMEMARESFGIERDLGWEKVLEFNPQSFDQLPAFLAYYYYNQISSQSPGLSLLEKFIFTVDAVKEETEVSPEKIADILSHPVYGCGNFSKLGLYYRIVKQYPGKERTFFSVLWKMKEEMLKAGGSQREIERNLIAHIRSNIGYNSSDAELLELLYAAGILSWRDQLLSIGDRISFASDTLLSFSEARDKIISDVKDGKLGWLGVLDVDQLRKFNAIYGKEIMNFILEDIRKVINFFLFNAGGFAFAYRRGDEIGLYLPEGGKEDIGVIMGNIRKYIGDLKYGVFYIDGGSLTLEELDRIKDVLQRYNVHINGQKYGGLQLGIMRIKGENAREEISAMMGEIKERLGREFSFDFYLEEAIKEVSAPTLSGGIIHLGNLSGDSTPEDIFDQACYRAQDTQSYAKTQGRDNIVVGFRSEYRHTHSGRGLITDAFRSQLDDADEISELNPLQSSELTLRIYNEQEFRNIVYEYLRTPENEGGLLLWVCPRYNGNEGLHEMNTRYTLQGGDDIIRTIAYFLENNLKALGMKEAIIGRRIDRFFVFLPGAHPENVNYEKILGIFSMVQHDFEKEIPEVKISFDVYGAFDSVQAFLEPGRIFQEVMEAEKEERPLYFDLWGNTLGLFGAHSEEEAARVERVLSEEALENLVVEILTQRILPQARTQQEIKIGVESDSILRHIHWDYIYRILQKYNLLPLEEGFIPCLSSLPC